VVYIREACAEYRVSGYYCETGAPPPPAVPISPLFLSPDEGACNRWCGVSRATRREVFVSFAHFVKLLGCRSVLYNRGNHCYSLLDFSTGITGEGTAFMVAGNQSHTSSLSYTAVNSARLAARRPKRV
jgi:hypothetical protein